jgi:ABC-type sulfate transport system permease component
MEDIRSFVYSISFEKRRMLVKRFMGYLVYALFIGIVVYLGVKYGQYLKVQAGRTFNPHSLYAFIAFYPIVIGMFLAVPGLVSRMQQEGKWIIDWQILLPIGLPTLVFNVNLLMNNLFLFRFEWYQSIVTDARVYDISGIVCGYVLLTSLTRVTLTKEKDIPSGEEIS